MSNSITIIDYGCGNIWSIKNALKFLKINFELSNEPSKILKSKIIILPGVGSFSLAMNKIKSNGMDDAIKEAVKSKGSKILGICLGMQLLAKSSTEGGYSNGLGLIPASVSRINENNFQDLIKIPHIGFNRISHNNKGIFKGLEQNCFFYFDHSFYITDKNLLKYNAICSYGENFLAGYQKDNIFAVQFHPEKSQTNGLILLYNFFNS